MSETRHENPMSVRSKSMLSKALLSLMMKKPFEDISISDIAIEAGLSRQTFYTNFEHKEDIIIYLLDEFFRRYCVHLNTLDKFPQNIIADYFIFWNGYKDLLRLLFNRGLGYLFYEENRCFFREKLCSFETSFSAEDWQRDYIYAGLSGITFELLQLWIIDENGLSLSLLQTLADNFMSGKIFCAN